MTLCRKLLAHSYWGAEIYCDLPLDHAGEHHRGTPDGPTPIQEYESIRPPGQSR